MTNETAMLKALLNGLKINPKFQPQNNKQAYLAYLCGLDIALPEPRTVEEILLCKLCADGGKYLHTMTIRTYLGKITMTLINNSAESLTRVYRENTDIFNGAILMIPAADIGQDEDFYATVIGYEYSGDVGILMIDKDFPFPVISSMPNVIDVISGEVIDNVSTKDGGKLEQEKKVEITKNGVTEIFPDEGYTLSRVVAIANVGGGENKLNQVLTKTVTEITVEDTQGGATIPQNFCSSCMQLTKVEMSPSITYISGGAFNYCNKLENVTFSPNITKIDSSAFHQCWKLSSPIVLPNVTTIGNNAFNRCDYVPYVVLPKIKTIGSDAFLYTGDGNGYIRIGNAITTISGSSALKGFKDIYIDKPEGSISGAPWGAANATIHWNAPIPDEFLPSEEA